MLSNLNQASRCMNAFMKKAPISIHSRYNFGYTYANVRFKMKYS